MAGSAAGLPARAPRVGWMRSFRHGVLATRDGVREVGAEAAQHWRQSLQLRVITTTMLLGVVVVSVLGGVLHSQIASGLERDRIEQSENEALNLTSKAQSYWDATTSTSVGELNQTASDIMSSILAAPGVEDPSRYVVMSRSLGNESDIVLVELVSPKNLVDTSVISPELEAAVAADPSRQQVQQTAVTVDGRDYFLPEPVSELKREILEAIKAGGGYVTIPPLRGGPGIEVLFSPGMPVTWTQLDIAGEQPASPGVEADDLDADDIGNL